MSGEDIAVLCTVGPAGLGVLGLIIHVLMEGTEDKLWPRGLRWLPGLWLDTGEWLHRLMLRIFWPERLPLFKGRKILQLESYKQQWECWAGLTAHIGEPPRWEPYPGKEGHGRWEPYDDRKHGGA